MLANLCVLRDRCVGLWNSHPQTATCDPQLRHSQLDTSQLTPEHHPLPQPSETTTFLPAPITPLRGTQSLVGVMAFVWQHPSLTALEVLWRWLAAAPLLWLAWHALAPAFAAVPLDTIALQGMTFFEPVRSIATLAQQAALYLPALRRAGQWWLPLALSVWLLAAALGRSAVLRRADRSLHANLPRIALFSLLRALAFLGLLALWALGLRAALHATITTPGQRGAEPNLVLFTAAAVALTLAAFILWSLTVWALDLQLLQTLTQLRPGTPPQRHELRSKLVETNFVMGIVRVALLVLALTFSASPLPFQSRGTQAYITVWWIGVGFFYLLASDFFHVVRRLTYLRFLQTIARETNVVAAPAS